MPTITDPARELAEVCEALSQNVDQRGYSFLASQFNVDPWSAEFFQILFCIMDRINYVEMLVGGLNVDEDVKAELISCLRTMRSAFGENSLSGNWRASGGPDYLKHEYSRPIKALSGQVRAVAPVPKLDVRERDELISQLDELLTWLSSHQLAEQDFIRQALIDGLKQFRFRLEKMRWVGWGYTLAGLRDVIGAYLALERGSLQIENSTHAAILKKVGELIKSAYSKLGAVKEMSERGDFILRAYGAYSLVAQSGVAGLLSVAGS